MQSRTALIGAVVLATAFVGVSPRAALNPGRLTAGHAELANDCLACHTLLQGTPAAKCIGCHPLDSIGIRRAAPTLPGSPRPALAGMHDSFAKTDCLECHTDHVGPEPKGTTRAFSHEALSLDFRQRCSSCHEGRRPHDNLHQQGAGECGSCHVTRAWTPATFKHDDFFFLDGDHQARCVTCHTQPSNYRSYTCYGCHEHSEARIASKHREEGIGNFSDCVRCHRSARDHEGDEGRGGGEGGDREHDD